MIYGIIDVGSNTIRLLIYQYEAGALKTLLSEKNTAGLAGYVEDGALSRGGIERACQVIGDYQTILKNFKITNVHVFATASLRNISNTAQVTAAIKAGTGFEVDVISGEEEATLDFLGATHALPLKDKDGLLIDIGGGSTELAVYSQAQLIKASSIPVGSLNMFSRHVVRLFPNKIEKELIEQNVREELNKLALNREQPCRIICGVGGTIRAAGKLNRYLLADETLPGQIPMENIQKMLKLLHRGDKLTLRRILQVVPDRIHTIIPGLLILRTVADYFGCQTIYISNYGVREGYLYRRILNS